jgi:hypothetical protein
MAAMRDQMIAASKPGPDGLPIFNLFVRTKKANVSSVVSVYNHTGFYGVLCYSIVAHIFVQMWYPCGSFKGDEKSRALASNYRDKGLLAGISKNQLDSGIEGSLFRDLDKLNGTVLRAYPQLRKSKDELQYGYRLAFEGLPDDEPIVEVTPKEQKGIVDNIKGMFSG